MSEAVETFEKVQNAESGDLIHVADDSGGWTDYLIFGLPNLHSVEYRYDARGAEIEALVISPQKAEEMARLKVPLAGDDSSKFSRPVKSTGKPLRGREYKALLEDLKKGESEPERVEDPESVQTADQAKVYNNPELVKEVQKIFEGTGCQGVGIDKLTEVVKTLVLAGDKEIEIPFLYTTYLCTAGGALLPSETTFVWDYVQQKMSKIVKCAFVGVTTEIYKEFMYEYVTKSSAITAGLSLGLAGPPGSLITPAPKKGAKIFDHGKEKVDASGTSMNFNFSWMKTWARLRVEASFKVKDEIKDFKCISTPL